MNLRFPFRSNQSEALIKDPLHEDPVVFLHTFHAVVAVHGRRRGGDEKCDHMCWRGTTRVSRESAERSVP